MFLRTVIESYDPATHSATVRPLAHPAATLEGIPAASDIPGERLCPGAHALVLLLEDASPLVLAPYGEPFAAWPSGAVDYNAFYTLTATAGMTYIPHPYLSLSLSTAQPAHFWVAFAGAYVAQNTRSWNLICRTLINGEPTGVTCIVDKVSVGGWYQLGMSFRTTQTYAPGTYTFQMGFMQQQAGDQVRPAGVHLSVLALPA